MDKKVHDLLGGSAVCVIRFLKYGFLIVNQMASEWPYHVVVLARLNTLGEKPETSVENNHNSKTDVCEKLVSENYIIPRVESAMVFCAVGSPRNGGLQPTRPLCSIDTCIGLPTSLLNRACMDSSIYSSVFY